MTTLYPVNIKIEAKIKNFRTVIRNEEAINSSIDSLFSFLDGSDEIKKTIEKAKKQIKDSYISSNTLVLYSKQAEKKLFLFGILRCSLVI